jgi:hypothetical protein
VSVRERIQETAPFQDVWEKAEIENEGNTQKLIPKIKIMLEYIIFFSEYKG